MREIVSSFWRRLTLLSNETKLLSEKISILNSENKSQYYRQKTINDTEYEKLNLERELRIGRIFNVETIIKWSWVLWCVEWSRIQLLVLPKALESVASGEENQWWCSRCCSWTQLDFWSLYLTSCLIESHTKRSCS